MSKLRPTYAFMKTLEFLSGGRLYLKNSVKAITLSYNTWGHGSSGLRKFVSQKLPPIQFKNPDVQVLTFKNNTPTPFVKVYFGDGKKVTLDVEGKHPETILEELAAVAAKSEAQVERDLQAAQAEYNPANFGDARRGRLCICEVPGQVPCPSKVPLTNVEHKWHDKESRASNR